MATPPASATAARTRIFLSYRVDDTEHAVGRLAEDLREHFGAERVFQDMASILPGTDFVEALQSGLATCAATLVMIGPKWLHATDKNGRRRLDDPDDWVRREVIDSLQSEDVRVFPVLVGAAQMPAPEDLPEPLRSLPRRQAFPLTSRHWRQDVALLIEHLARTPGLAPTSAAPLPASAPMSPADATAVARRRWPVYASVGAATMAVVGGYWFSTRNDGATGILQGPASAPSSGRPVLAASSAAIDRTALRPAPATREVRRAAESLLNPDQERRMRRLINVFETGDTSPAYDHVNVIPASAAGLTYGATQASRGSGDLASLLRAYVAADGATLAQPLQPFLAALERRDPALDTDQAFIGLLRRAGRDAAMQDLQDQIFSNRYLRPAVSAAQANGIRTPLGVAVVVDSVMHGSFKRLRDQTAAKLGGTPASGVDERRWIKAYLDERRSWLSTLRVDTVRPFARRADALLELVAAGNWELEPPISVSVRLR
jgi:hypothetical protein